MGLRSKKCFVKKEKDETVEHGLELEREQEAISPCLCLGCILPPSRPSNKLPQGSIFLPYNLIAQDRGGLNK